MLTPAGQTVSFLTTAPVRNDPVDPATRSFNEIMRLLDRLPQSFPSVGRSSAPCRTRPESRASRARPGFAHELWLPVGRRAGVRSQVDRPAHSVHCRRCRECPLRPEADRQARATVPQLGLFVQGDFRGTIDWTSQAAHRDRRSTSRDRLPAASKAASGVLRPKASKRVSSGAGACRAYDGTPACRPFRSLLIGER